MMLEISFASTADQKKSTEIEKETEKATTNTKPLNKNLFENIQERKKYKITRKTINDDNPCLGEIVKPLMVVLQL